MLKHAGRTDQVTPRRTPLDSGSLLILAAVTNNLKPGAKRGKWGVITMFNHGLRHGSDSGAPSRCVKDRVAHGGIANDSPSPTARNFFEFWTRPGSSKDADSRVVNDGV
jgi:hypothetical protein